MVREKKDSKKTEDTSDTTTTMVVEKRASKVAPVADEKKKRKRGSVRMERMLDSIASGDTEIPHTKTRIHGGHRKNTAAVHIKQAKENRACVLPKAPLSRIIHEAMQMGVPDVQDGGDKKRGRQMRIERKAFAIVREAIENELCRRIRGAKEIALYSKRKTVMGNDMDFYNHLTQKTQAVAV